MYCERILEIKKLRKVFNLKLKTSCGEIFPPVDCVGNLCFPLLSPLQYLLRHGSQPLPPQTPAKTARKDEEEDGGGGGGVNYSPSPDPVIQRKY